MEQIVDLMNACSINPVFANLVIALVAVLSFLYGKKRR